MKVSGILFALLWLGSPAIAQDDVNERLPKQGNEAGKAAYMANCAACQQPDGKCLAGAFPPLANADYLNERSGADIAGDVLKGITGELTVHQRPEIQQRCRPRVILAMATSPRSSITLFKLGQFGQVDYGSRRGGEAPRT
ncbi:cytochrome c [Dokdonella sp.]|uniref:c-type cytochrome n=1 Tax=Dokdonella sp. TaxID=2291710 RepID=UPI0035288BD9